MENGHNFITILTKEMSKGGKVPLIQGKMETTFWYKIE